jgi:pyruvate/2-oxoglutarate dehydrogenase complex dihydrolipoamide acyltransferase (E2) component
MHSAGARVLREDDNQMSREAVLLQWERKIEVAERLEDESAEVATAQATSRQPTSTEATQATELDEPVPLRPEPAPRRGRFERSTPAPSAAPAPEPIAERRTITITGRPTPGHAAPGRRRRAVVDAQLAQPDRIALWAFLLGLLLVAVAAGTAHA